MLGLVATFDPGPVPVYISSDTLGQTRLSYAGLGAGNSYDEEIRWLRVAIDIVNSASADTPRLYYAGIDSDVDFNDGFADLNPGVTVMAWTCPGLGAVAGTDAGTAGDVNKARIRLTRGGEHVCSGSFDFYVDPDHLSSPAYSSNDRDYLGVLVHELVHAMGLNHTDFSEGPIWNGNCTNPYDPAIAAVMNTNSSQFFADWRHRLRRDDIEGLRDLHGEPERAVYLATSTTVPASGWTLPSALNAAIATNTPVALSSASDQNDTTLLLGFTNSSDEFRYLTGDSFSCCTNAAGGGTLLTTAGGNAVTSVEKIAVARGTEWDDTAERRLFAWVSSSTSSLGEDVNDPEVKIYWRVYSDSTWRSVENTGPTRYKNFGVGYDPRMDYFVLAYADNYPTDSLEPDEQFLYVRTIKAWNGGGGCTQAFTTLPDLHILEIGDVSCDYYSSTVPTSCVIPVSALSLDGPVVQFVEGTIDTFAGFQCFVKDAATPLVHTASSYGHMSSAMQGYDPFVFGNPSSNYADMLGTYSPQSDPVATPGRYGKLFAMERDSGGLTGTATNLANTDTNYWPARVGSQSREVGSPHTKWYAVTY